MNREEIAWAGGLFEGEGCFNLSWPDKARSRGPYPRALLLMTDEDSVRRFHKIIGFGQVGGPYNHQNHEKWKSNYRWTAHGFEKTQAFVAMVWPWLGERRREAAIRVLRECKYKSNA